MNVHVRVMCDNVTAVTYINEMGGCKSEQCNSVAKLFGLGPLPDIFGCQQLTLLDRPTLMLTICLTMLI